MDNSNNKFFEPEIINNYFVEITKISRPSRKEDPIRNWVIKKVEDIKSKYQDNRSNIKVVQYEQQATEPGERNIILSRDGSGDFTGSLPVILQAHLDMVTVPSEDIFPLKLEEYSKNGSTWLTATGTTLGADDGIGVATILAFLEDEEMKDRALECVFTVQEEVDMGGAKGLDVSKLKGKEFINLDAEDLTTIIYGSAGGCETQLSGTIQNNSVTGEEAIKVSISGLKSGHSGVDINKGRLNAIKVLTKMLIRLNKRINNFENGDGINTYDLIISDIKRADGIKSNSIPAAAEAIIYLGKTEGKKFSDDFRKLAELIKEENQPVEKDFDYNVVPANFIQCLTKPSTDALLLLLDAIPTGVVRMIPSNPALVETSSNLYDVSISKDKVAVKISNRSSDEQSFESLKKLQGNIGTLFGYTIETNIDAYPSWQPNEDSGLLKTATGVYAKMYGANNYDATVIHAGLECSWMIEKCEGKMDCISVGPTIRNPHTVDESLQIIKDRTQTVVEFYNSVKKIVNEISKTTKKNSIGAETASY